MKLQKLLALGLMGVVLTSCGAPKHQVPQSVIDAVSTKEALKATIESWKELELSGFTVISENTTANSHAQNTYTYTLGTNGYTTKTVNVSETGDGSGFTQLQGRILTETDYSDFTLFSDLNNVNKTNKFEYSKVVETVDPTFIDEITATKAQQNITNASADLNLYTKYFREANNGLHNIALYNANAFEYTAHEVVSDGVNSVVTGQYALKTATAFTLYSFSIVINDDLQPVSAECGWNQYPIAAYDEETGALVEDAVASQVATSKLESVNYAARAELSKPENYEDYLVESISDFYVYNEYYDESAWDYVASEPNTVWVGESFFPDFSVATISPATALNTKSLVLTGCDNPDFFADETTITSTPDVWAELTFGNTWNPNLVRIEVKTVALPGAGGDDGGGLATPIFDDTILGHDNATVVGKNITIAAGAEYALFSICTTNEGPFDTSDIGFYSMNGFVNVVVCDTQADPNWAVTFEAHVNGVGEDMGAIFDEAGTFEYVLSFTIEGSSGAKPVPQLSTTENYIQGLKNATVDGTNVTITGDATIAIVSDNEGPFDLSTLTIFTDGIVECEVSTNQTAGNWFVCFDLYIVGAAGTDTVTIRENSTYSMFEFTVTVGSTGTGGAAGDETYPEPDFTSDFDIIVYKSSVLNTNAVYDPNSLTLTIPGVAAGDVLTLILYTANQGPFGDLEAQGYELWQNNTTAGTISFTDRDPGTNWAVALELTVSATGSFSCALKDPKWGDNLVQFTITLTA